MARRSQPFRHTVRRGTFWGRSPADAAVTALAGGAAILDSTAIPAPQGQTISRIRGHLAVRSDQNAAGEDTVGAVGVLVASDEAVAVGVGSLPTPYTDQDSDLWMMHQYFSHSFTFLSSVGFQDQSFSIWEFDSKAMRKMESGQTMCFIVENGAAAGSGISYYLNFAVLFKVA